MKTKNGANGKNLGKPIIKRNNERKTIKTQAKT